MVEKKKLKYKKDDEVVFWTKFAGFSNLQGQPATITDVYQESNLWDYRINVLGKNGEMKNVGCVEEELDDPDVSQ